VNTPTKDLIMAEHDSPNAADVAAEANALAAGLGLITVTLFPFALPLLLLCIAPLLPLIVVGALLAAILYLPVRLVRFLTRTVARRRAEHRRVTSRRTAPPALRTPM
jgi:hypothetical protein